MTPGEQSADGFSGFLTPAAIPGELSRRLNGSSIVLEHRFFGKSNPYNNLTVESLQVHTIQQAIDDLDYFAKNVKLPQPDGDSVAPGKAPWIFVGGSYPGALVSYAMYKCVGASSPHQISVLTVTPRRITASRICFGPAGRPPVSCSPSRALALLRFPPRVVLTSCGAVLQ